MLVAITSEGFDIFETMSSSAKHNYLWGLESMASEISELVRIAG